MAAEVSTSSYRRKKSAPRLLPVAYTSTASWPVTQRMASKSCTPQSRKIPPETATYSGGGGSGSRVVDRIVVIQPSSPLTTPAPAAAMAAAYRRWNPIWTGTVEPSRRRRSSAPAAPVCATGFSHSVGSPASTQARTSSGWASGPAAMTTPSRSESSSAATESAPSTPAAACRSTTCLVRSGTRSVTTSDSIAGMPTSVPAWKAPILPSPMSPMRMLSLSAEYGRLVSPRAACAVWMCSFVLTLMTSSTGRTRQGRMPRPGVGSGGVLQRRVCAAGPLGAVAGVDDQGDVQGVGDRDGDRCTSADAVDELPHLRVEVVDVVQLRELGELVLLGARERGGEPAGLPRGGARTPALAGRAQVDPDRLREDADLQQAAGAVEGHPGALEPLQRVVSVEVEHDLQLRIGEDHGGGVLPAGGVRQPGVLAHASVDAVRATVDGQQDVEHVAADDPQRPAHVGGLVEVLGQVFADEWGAVGTDGDDVADEPLVEQLPGTGHRVGEAHVVADLRDRPRRRSGLGQLPDVGQRGAARLLDQHGLAGVEDAQGQRNHVLALGVHHHRRDAVVGEQLVGGDRREVVLVGEVLQPGIVVGGGHDLPVVDLAECADARRGVRMGDAQESYDDGLGHVLLLCAVGRVWTIAADLAGGAPVQAARRRPSSPSRVTGRGLR